MSLEPPPNEQALIEQLLNLPKLLEDTTERWFADIPELMRVARYLHPEEQRDLACLRAALTGAVAGLGDNRWSEAAGEIYELTENSEGAGIGARLQFAAERVRLAQSTVRQRWKVEVPGDLAGQLLLLVKAREETGQQPPEPVPGPGAVESAEEPNQDEVLSVRSDAAPSDDGPVDTEPTASLGPPASGRPARRSVVVGLVVLLGVAVAAVLIGSLVGGGNDGSDSLSQVAGSCPATTTEKALAEWQVLGGAGAVLLVAKLNEAGPVPANGWEDQIDDIKYEPDSERKFALAFINKEPIAQTSPVVRVTLPSGMSLVSGSTCIYGKVGLESGKSIATSTLVGRAGLALPSVQPSSSAIVTFSAQLAAATDLPCGETEASMYARIDTNQDDEAEPVATARLWGSVNRPC